MEEECDFLYFVRKFAALRDIWSQKGQMTRKSLVTAVPDRDYRAVGLRSVAKRSHSTSRPPKTKLPALSVPVPETHHAVSHKEDRGGVVA